MFFHVLSFSWVLKICFFLGINFDTISIDSSYVKNQFLGHLGGWGGVPLWALFSYLFFLPFFFCLFSCFLFFHFFFFLFISSFFDFLMFFIFRRKSFFFSFFLYFSEICFIAGVSIRV